MLATNIYNLDNLISFNSKLEDYFTNNTAKAINDVYEKFLSSNINKLKNKDKSVLKDISKLNVNYVLIDNLNFLWNKGFNTNEDNFSNYVLSEFTKLNKENINKNKKLTKTIKKEDKELAKDIRKRDIEEKRKTLKVLKQDIITSNFGQIYLQERNREIAKNFTNTYQEKIFNAISKYLNSKLSITREKNLINHLSFKRLSDLSEEERNSYINEYNLDKQRIEQVYGIKVESLGTYDSLVFNPKERIRRIAKTELSAAYNLARYNELVNQGYVEFIWKTTGKADCELCTSKNGDIITIEEILDIDRGFSDFRGIDTRKNKNAPENRAIVIPLSHPNCFLAGTKVLMENGLSKNIEDITIGEKVVVGCNLDKTIRVKKVYNSFHNVYNGNIITLILENGKTITATENHEIFDGKQFRYIKDFNVGDFTYSFNESNIEEYRTSLSIVSNTQVKRKKIQVSSEIFSGLTKLRVKEIKKEYYEGLVYNISVDEFGEYNYYFASNDDCFILTHNCRCYLVGNPKTKQEPVIAKSIILNELKKANNIYNTAIKLNNISTNYLNLNKQNTNNNSTLNNVVTAGSIMSLGMMYYLFSTSNLVPNFLTNSLEEPLIDALLEGSNLLIEGTNQTLQSQLKTAVLNKNFNQDNLYQLGYKPPTVQTLSEYLNTQQRNIINEQVANGIKQLITKQNLSEVFKSSTIDGNGISNLTQLAKNNQERQTLQNVETLLNTLIINNKTTDKQKLLNLIYEDNTVNPVIAKLPLNIKQSDLELIRLTENKELTSTNKLEQLSINATSLVNEVKKNKNNYLQDIEKLRELDSQLTDELVGIERVNTEYNQLLETTTDKNLSKYLTNKITENNQKTTELRNKLNDISGDLYGTKLDKIDSSIKDKLIDNIRNNGDKYLEFKNNSTNKIKSINTTLDNYKKDTTIDKLNFDYINKKLAELDILELELQDVNKNSLLLDNILGDYAILTKIDNTVDKTDLGYTFNTYLNTSSKRSKQVASIDRFRETTLTNTTVNLDNYKKKLISAKYKLLNGQTITEFRINNYIKFNKQLCHLKLKNILEKLKRD